VKPPSSVATCRSKLVTVTSTGPVGPPGVVAVRVVPVTTTTSIAARPPNATLAPLVKPVPVMVTTVFPVMGPDVGPSEVMTGGGLTGTGR